MKVKLVSLVLLATFTLANSGVYAYELTINTTSNADYAVASDETEECIIHRESEKILLPSSPENPYNNMNRGVSVEELKRLNKIYKSTYCYVSWASTPL